MSTKIQIKSVGDTIGSLMPCSFKHFGAELQTLTKSFYSLTDCVPGDRERTERHFDSCDRVGLRPHFRTSGETAFCQSSVMNLAHLDSDVRDVVASADVIGLEAEGQTLLDGRTRCLE